MYLCKVLVCFREQIMRNNIFSKIVGNFGGTAYIQVFNIHKICITVESDIIYVFKQVKVRTVVGSSVF